MNFCETGVFLFILFLASAENQKIESCEKYRYQINSNTLPIHFYKNYFISLRKSTWDELIAAVPKLNSIPCRELHLGTFIFHDGKLVEISLVRTPEYAIFYDQHILKHILALSSDFQKISLLMGHNIVSPVILEESMFLSNKQLNIIAISAMGIQEIRVNTFLYLENLKELILSDCQLRHFNPNELPSSLEHLYLRENLLQTFELSKPLINLVSLDLNNNFLAKFILDMKNLLPNIRLVSLVRNIITDFQPIDNNLNHTLKILDLRYNQIRNVNAYEWILLDNLTDIVWEGNLPLCDCSSKGTLDRLVEENIVHSCILPVPGKFKILIKRFECPGNDSRDSTCTRSASEATLVYNCSKALWPPEIHLEVAFKGTYQNCHLYCSGNSNATFLPTFPAVFATKTDTHIYAENCNLRSPLSEKNFPKQNLRHLYLAKNNIDEIDVEILEILIEMETHLTLAHNPLICDCHHKTMYETILKMAFLIDDFNEMTCNDGLPFADRSLCFAWETFLLYSSLVLFAILTSFLVIFLRYTLEIQVYIYSRGWFPAYFRTEPDEANYKYDVFVSYSDKDEDFVVSVIDFLENEVSPPFKVCHHHRDWIVGERIDRQIITSVEESRKTIIILSKSFLTSYWANMEFRTALYIMLEEKAPKLVLVIHGDIGPTKELKPEIRSYIKTTTYLASNDKWFWEKLTYSLRRPSKTENPEPVEEGIELAELNV